MKFTDGYWKVRSGCNLFQAVSAGEVEAGLSEVTVYVSCAQSGGRKDLGGVTLSITLFSPMEDCIGVRLTHHLGGRKAEPAFFSAAESCGRVQVFEDRVILTSGKARALLHRGSEWKLEFYYDGNKLTQSGWRSAGYARFDDGTSYVKEELQLSVGENVYGLGERFTPFVKNGQSVEIWNRDGGTSSEQAYKNIPFYVTDKGYGVLVNDAGRVCYEVASEKVERVQFCVPGESLEYCVIGAGCMRDAVKRYNLLTGVPALPPAWSFGLWLTTSFTTDYDEKTVTHFIDGMATRDIPLQVFHFDCFWMKGGHWCDFQWDRQAFPDPEGMLRRLKARGLKICVWINPYIAQRSAIFREGMENGYFLRRTDGSVWQTDEWQPGMAIVDFTNPKACRWYQEKLQILMDMGVDTFKTDFGERIPEKDVIYADGTDPEKMHNYYTYLYNRTVFSYLEEKLGRGQALVFARSAACGGQKFPVHCGGDCVASFESMAESLRGGLSLSMGGFGFWSHDMGGFENKATPDLYKRWTAFGMFSTHSRLHGNSSYRVPWLFDEEAVDVLRHFTKAKCALMPYLYAQAVSVHETAVPMMRPMVMEFQNDPSVPFLDRQYMLGDSLLVAPVFSEDGVVQYYLPQGKWTNYFTGRTARAGWQKEKWDYFGLPVMVRENTILATGRNDRTVYDYEKDLCLRVYELRDCAKTILYRADGSYAGYAQAQMQEGTIRFWTEGLTGYTVLFVNRRQAYGLKNAWGEPAEDGFLVRPQEDAASFEIGFWENGK